MTEESSSYPQWLNGVVQAPLVWICQRDATDATGMPQSRGFWDLLKLDAFGDNIEQQYACGMIQLVRRNRSPL